jgi:dTDP-L-rhamnose 4-epimerase
LSKLRVLVTGGAGFIGSHLAEAVLERGHTVRVVDRLVPQVHHSGSPQYLPDGVEFLQGDVTDPDLMARAVDGVDAVFHQAAEVGVGQSMYEIGRYVHANALGTAVLLEALLPHRDRIEKLVVASSMSIYGEGAYRCRDHGEVDPGLRPPEQLLARDWEAACPQCGLALTPLPTPESKRLAPTSIYAVTKQDQEQYSLVVGRAYGIPTVALRYFNVYGTRQSLSNPYTGACAIFASRLLNGKPPLIFEDGRQARDFVHVSDIVRANLLALEHDTLDYQAVNIGTGEPTSILDLAQLLAKLLGVDLEPELVGQYREGDIRHCIADISLARDGLGFTPGMAVADGLADLVDWAREQHAVDDVARATSELADRGLVR